MNGSSLEKAICNVNDLLSHDLPPDRFVTAAVGVLEPAKYRMHFFSAGHGPIFFYDARKRTVYKWPANDRPLGIKEGKITGKPSEILFYPGDILVLITDGFFEWRNSGEEPFGENRIAQAIQRLNHLNSDALIDGLYREVIDFSNGTKQADDLTALVIKRIE
jgi:phosphoserine phosphatase